MEFEQDIDIEKPIDEVTELLSDPDHVAHWHRDLVRIERVSGEPGSPGAKSVLHYDHKGRKFQLQETMLVHRLPEESVATYEAMGMKHTLTTRLEPIDDTRTRVKLHNHMELSGMAKLAFPMLSGSLQEQTDKRVLDLKRWAETGSVDPD